MEALLASKRDPTMRAHDSKSFSAGSVLLSIAAVALAGMVGTITLIQQVGEFGPRVGDIISFDPLDAMSRDMHPRVPAMPADDKAGVACMLDAQVMHASGGSLIIEARQPQASFGYQVHWAGPRTSNDGADCGSSANLLVNVDDIDLLAVAAGGYGVPTDKHAANIIRASSSRQ